MACGVEIQCVMGNLLRVLSKDPPSPKFDIFVDFENCQPTQEELQVWTRVESVLRYANTILFELQSYPGAGNEIREAINNPRNEEQQEKAMSVVVPLVSQLKRYYDFSLHLENMIPQVLRELCNNELTPKLHLEQQQALFKQFAEIIDFTLKFDDLKMSNPAIQNDFSYYRRTLGRIRMANEDHDEQFDVDNEMANRMSLFYANATPMLKVLSNTTSKFVSENKDLPVENTTDCLSTMANICRVMIENHNYRSRITNDDTILFILRVMVGVIILYDHVHPVGAFAKSSNIDIKSCLKVLQNQQTARVEGLMNALRFTTVHLNDETTPKGVKALLA